MEELSIEEKAKAYDDLLVRLKKAKVDNDVCDERYCCVIDDIVPELKENEDELTWLTNYISEEVYSLSMDIRDNEDRIKLKKLQKSLAWLKKRGEQKPIERKNFISIPFGAYDSELVEESITIPDGCYATIEGNKIYIKKKDKSATEAIKLNHIVDNNEMAEPPFKAGDWVVRRDGETFSNGNKFAQIQSIELGGIMCDIDTGGWVYPSKIRLWTIADAKDGDVLATEDWIFIFEKMNSNGKPVCHCHYDIELGFRIDVNSYIATGSEIYPATKEQRDTLEKAMADAGYAFDFEKKDLKKVEDKNPLLSDFFKAEYERGRADAQKLAEWSEEDEKMFRGVIAICDIWSTKTSFYPKENDDIVKLKNWLESLKDKAQSNQGEMSKMCPISVQDKL